MWDAFSAWEASLPFWGQLALWIGLLYICYGIYWVLANSLSVLLDILASNIQMGLTRLGVALVAIIVNSVLYPFRKLKIWILNIKPYTVILKGKHIHFITYNSTDALDGIIKSPPYKGSKLSSLPFDKQCHLFQICNDDQDSLGGMNFYMKTYYGENWQLEANSKRREYHKQQERKDEGSRKQQQQEEPPPRSHQGKMTYAHALEVLDIPNGDNLTQEDLKKRYRSIMAKVHPDKGGSNFFAKQVNEAFDIVRKHHGW